MGFFMKCKSIFGGFQLPTSHLLCFLQPLGQDGFQLAGVLEAQLQVLKAANRRLAELGAVHSSQGFSNVGLCVTCQKQRKKQLGSFPGGLPSLRCSAFAAGSCGQCGCSASRLSSQLSSLRACSVSWWFLCSVTLIHWSFTLQVRDLRRIQTHQVFV